MAHRLKNLMNLMMSCRPKWGHSHVCSDRKLLSSLISVCSCTTPVQVLSVGKACEGFKVGDQVICMSLFGAYATHMRIPYRNAWKLPSTLTLEQGAALPVVGITAYYAIFELVHPRPGASVLIHSGECCPSPICTGIHLSRMLNTIHNFFVMLSSSLRSAVRIFERLV